MLKTAHDVWHFRIRSVNHKKELRTRGIWKVHSMVFYLSNRLTNPYMSGITLKLYLSSMLRAVYTISFSCTRLLYKKNCHLIWWCIQQKMISFFIVQEKLMNRNSSFFSMITYQTCHQIANQKQENFWQQHCKQKHMAKIWRGNIAARGYHGRF